MHKLPSGIRSYAAIVAVIIGLSTLLVSCQNPQPSADPIDNVTVDSPSDNATNQPEEIDELAGIPEITMAELAESMDGETLYINNCAKCHGLTGLGDGPSVGSLNTQYGLNLTILDNMTDDEISYIISVGRGMEMPPWELLLSQTQIQNLTEYVRGLAKSS